MCGGFSCSKNTLIGLNIVYVMVSFLLIGVATYGRTASVITSLPIISGIVASGVFLLLVAVLGLIGTVKHHQVMLFFYMVILFLIFLIQFSVACACLAVSHDTQINFARTAWNNRLHSGDNHTLLQAEKLFECCGFEDNQIDGVECDEVPACTKKNGTGWSCPSCKDAIEDKISYAFSSAGGLGLFFSFTEFVGIVYTYKMRVQLREMAEIA